MTGYNHEAEIEIYDPKSREGHAVFAQSLLALIDAFKDLADEGLLEGPQLVRITIEPVPPGEGPKH